MKKIGIVLLMFTITGSFLLSASINKKEENIQAGRAGGVGFASGVFGLCLITAGFNVKWALFFSVAVNSAGNLLMGEFWPNNRNAVKQVSAAALGQVAGMTTPLLLMSEQSRRHIVHAFSR